MAISKRAVNANVNRAPTFFYSSAREGMADLLAHAPDTTHQLTGVLLPRYIGWSPHEGSGVFDPVRESGRTYDFYGLRDDLTVDLGDLTMRLANGRFLFVVVIHYFGRTDPHISQLRSLVHKYGALLIEDLAHGFFTSTLNGGAGQWGDVSLYSLHKQFPLADGGMVVYRNDSLVTEQSSVRPELAEAILQYDWHAISISRRRNFTQLTSLLIPLANVASGFRLLWPALSEYDVPQSLPIILNGSHRDFVYNVMNEHGFGMVSLYHTLIPEVRSNAGVLGEVSRRIINFPVHQDVESRDLPEIVRAFKAAILSGLEEQ